MKFAQEWFPYFKEQKLKEIKSLMGSFVLIPTLAEFIRKQEVKDFQMRPVFFDTAVKS